MEFGGERLRGGGDREPEKSGNIGRNAKRKRRDSELETKIQGWGDRDTETEVERAPRTFRFPAE